MLEQNSSTSNMVDLIKYLLYKATGIDYGVTSIDFLSLFNTGSLTSVGAGDYIVNIEMSSEDIVITDLETLKLAFSGYSGSNKLIENAEYFLKMQDEYGVNAIFAAAVAVAETGGGRAGHAINGKINWFNISCTCGNSSHGRFETYSSVENSIEAFYKLIANGRYYFTQGNYTVSSIGMIYCEDADADGGWIDTVNAVMTQMFNSAGIDTTRYTSSSDVVEFALSCLGMTIYDFQGYSFSDGGGTIYIEAWCADFVSYCFDQCGLIPTKLTHSYKACSTGINYAKAAGKWHDRGNYTPKAGDIIFYTWGHTGIVTDCDGVYVYTVEGNSGSGTTTTRVVCTHNYTLTYSGIKGYWEM